MHVLSTGLDAVMAMAKGLPVTPVPKESRVTAVRHDVVNIGGLHVLPFLHALHTERVRFEVMLPGSAPCCSVPSVGCAGTVTAVDKRVLFTVLLPVRNKPRAAGMIAGCVWSARHTSHLPGQALLTEVAVAGDLVVVHSVEAQVLADATRSEIITIADAVLDELLGFPVRAEAIHMDGNRLRNSDRIRGLQFHLLGETSMHQVPRDLPQHVGCAPVNLARVFPGESTSANMG